MLRRILQGLCLPIECGPEVLVDPAVGSFVHDAMLTMVDRERSFRDIASSHLMTEYGQDTFNYYSKLATTFSVVGKTNTGYTCGTHKATMTADRVLFFVVFSILTITILVCTGVVSLFASNLFFFAHARFSSLLRTGLPFDPFLFQLIT